MARHGLSKGVLFFPWQPWMPATWSQVYGFVGGTGRLWLVGVDLAGLVSRDEDRRTGALTAFRENIVAAIQPTKPARARAGVLIRPVTSPHPEESMTGRGD